jgi:hypothetical protein
MPGQVDLPFVSLGPPAYAASGGLVSSGHDIVSSAMAPSDWTDNTAYYFNQTQATPAADSTTDLMAIPSYSELCRITPGCIWHPLVIARAPNGATETISARWYVDGVAVGSTVTFSNAQWNTIYLPTFQMDIYDWYAQLPLTLRFWGGTVHAAAMFFAARALFFDAKDYVDTADGATTVSDSLSHSGTAVSIDLNAGSPGDSLALLAGLDPPTQDFYEIAVVMKGSGTFTDPAITPDTDYPTYVDYEAGIDWRESGGGAFLGGLDDFVWRTWTPDFREGYSGTIFCDVATNTSAGDYCTNALTFGLDAGLTVDGSIFAHPEFDASNRHLIDRLIFGRTTVEMLFDNAPGPNFALGATISFDFTEPAYSNGVPGYFDYFEGRILDPSYNELQVDTPITSPWTIDTSILGAGSYIAVLITFLTDGSYAWTTYEYTVTSGAIVSFSAVRFPKRPYVSVR